MCAGGTCSAPETHRVLTIRARSEATTRAVGRWEGTGGGKGGVGGEGAGSDWGAWEVRERREAIGERGETVGEGRLGPERLGVWWDVLLGQLKEGRWSMERERGYDAFFGASRGEESYRWSQSRHA